ncbi:hypothetical protein DV736_g6501, partial [Chaetothyriales sp. CBS 134916]
MAKWERPTADAAYSESGYSEGMSSGGTGSDRDDHQTRTLNLSTSGLNHDVDYPSLPFAPNRDPSYGHRPYARPSRQYLEYAKQLKECKKDLEAHQKTKRVLLKQIAHLQNDKEQLLDLNKDAKQEIEDPQTQHFFKLSKLKLNEAEAFNDCHYVEAANKAENSALNFQQQRGEMLGLAGAHADAEMVFQEILKRREQLFGSDHIKGKESRDTMLSLAEALRKQDNDNKKIEAANLYQKNTSLIRIISQDEKSREWALRNNLGLIGVLYERRFYPLAKKFLSLFWVDQPMVPASHASELVVAEVLKIIDLLHCRMDLGDRDHLIDALAVICEPYSVEVNSLLLPCYIKFGKLLSQSTASGSSHNCYKQALSCLEVAWCDQSDQGHLSVEQGRSILWSMALAHASLGEWDEGKKSLNKLREFDLKHNYDCSISSTSTSSTTVTAGATDSTSPTQDMISALTARQQLSVGKFASAEKTAYPLVGIAHDRNYNITTSNLLSPHTAFHQTDTLLKALTKRCKMESFMKAKVIWDKVYDAVKRGEITDSDEIKMFAATGRSLAHPA